jgi:hypothetical protein
VLLVFFGEQAIQRFPAFAVADGLPRFLKHVFQSLLTLPLLLALLRGEKSNSDHKGNYVQNHERPPR